MRAGAQQPDRRLQRVEVGLNQGPPFGKTLGALSKTPLATPPPMSISTCGTRAGKKIHAQNPPSDAVALQSGVLVRHADGLRRASKRYHAVGAEQGWHRPVAIENIKGRLPPFTGLYNTLAEPFSFNCLWRRYACFVSSSYAYGCRFHGENGKQIYVTNGKIETNPPGWSVRRSVKRGQLIRSGQQERLHRSSV